VSAQVVVDLIPEFEAAFGSHSVIRLVVKPSPTVVP
jgi:hypothetical protein